MDIETTLRPRTVGPRSGANAARRVIITIAAVGVVAGGIIAGAATIAAAGPRAGFRTGSLQVAVLGDGGSVSDTSRHAFDVAGAYPGMPAQRSHLELQNSGTVPAAFDVSTTDVQPLGRRSLDDVLVVTIRDADTGSLAYRGPLSALRISGTKTVAPGTSTTYDVALTWPDLVDVDANDYQGAALAFTVQATAHASTD
jgi:hypothetical protein